MHSTQVYLTKEQIKSLQALKAQEGKPMAFLIREAVGEYLTRKRPKILTFEEALKRTAGLWKDRTDITDGYTYARKVRRQDSEEEEARMRRLWGR